MTITALLVVQMPVFDVHRWSVSHSVTPCALGLPGAPYSTTVSPATARKLVLGLTRFSFRATGGRCGYNGAGDDSDHWRRVFFIFVF